MPNSTVAALHVLTDHLVKEPWPSLTCKRRERLPERVNVITYGATAKLSTVYSANVSVTDTFCTSRL
jgi:hypothetical protein